MTPENRDRWQIGSKIRKHGQKPNKIHSNRLETESINNVTAHVRQKWRILRLKRLSKRSRFYSPIYKSTDRCSSKFSPPRKIFPAKLIFFQPNYFPAKFFFFRPDLSELDGKKPDGRRNRKRPDFRL